MKKHYYSNGKLLVTGEYAVLDGALSLALPTKYGQSLNISPKEGEYIVWKSYTHTKEIWFETIFELADIIHYVPVSRTSSTIAKASVRETLLRILNAAYQLNSNFLNNTKGLLVETHLNFPRDWGLGSSSTLINNIAQWAQVDAFKLLWDSFAGSGYDIACAQHKTPILYHLKKDIPVVEAVRFDPPFKNQLYFIHLNQKQNSRDGIAQYREKEFNLPHLISTVNEITKNLLKCQDLKEFNSLIDKHERLIADNLQMETVKAKQFPDFPGSIKSLGAWGGDFILATGTKETLNYFNKKGFKTVIPYSEMIL
ncbi:GHMP kinase [Sediminicola sp. YIK13]|uniref:GYDIA family GHMP kinase n=1 Tax=Sediminicola sp. YIK13 TaxID=1453352 RepID=UPI000722B2CF|nr:GYDIA family GHMP kinase [Sediminicola sp. YIK13]ALM08048.1 GHMP kinase [Sediminicola sp. YIK13]